MPLPPVALVGKQGVEFGTPLHRSTALLLHVAVAKLVLTFGLDHVGGLGGLHKEVGMVGGQQSVGVYVGYGSKAVERGVPSIVHETLWDLSPCADKRNG